MNVVKQILEHRVTFGGEPHSGWLPEGAAVPRPTLTTDVTLNITIESDGGGYLLCWASSDGTIANDLWFERWKMLNVPPLEGSASPLTNGKLCRELVLCRWRLSAKARASVFRKIVGQQCLNEMRRRVDFTVRRRGARIKAANEDAGGQGRLTEEGRCADHTY